MGARYGRLARGAAVALLLASCGLEHERAAGDGDHGAAKGEGSAAAGPKTPERAAGEAGGTVGVIREGSGAVPAPSSVVLTQSRPEPQRGRHACDPLPAVRPRGLSFAAIRTVVPHGGGPRREVAEVADAAERCAHPPLCRVLAPEALDTLYALAREHAPRAVRWTRTSRSPHYGSRYVRLVWGSGRCEVGESSQVELDEPGVAALRALFDAVVTAYAEASPSSGTAPASGSPPRAVRGREP